MAAYGQCQTPSRLRLRASVVPPGRDQRRFLSDNNRWEVFKHPSGVLKRLAPPRLLSLRVAEHPPFNPPVRGGAGAEGGATQGRAHAITFRK
ncbi:MAG: hypothetical protein LBK25_09710 [Treponema sp.]|nr:hypothetical protein [Treponema sp.]